MSFYMGNNYAVYVAFLFDGDIREFCDAVAVFKPFDHGVRLACYLAF
jgi:hypothetical protein